MRRVTLTAFLCLLALPLLAQHQTPDPDKIGHTTGDFATTADARKNPCPAIGDGKLADEPNPGVSDPYLNALKNRDVAPKESDYKTMKVAAILANPPAGATAAG